MRHPNPYPRCIFCDARANSREHAIPKWIGKRLGIKGFLNNFVYENNTERVIKPRKQAISFTSHRARIFCKACNAHFKHLEDATIPLAEPMARGQHLELSPDEQRTLAQWAAKTAMALVVATVPEFRDLIPEAQRRVVREQGLPPDDSWVAFFPWAGTPHIVIGDQTVSDDDVDPPISYKAWSAMLAFARVGFRVIGFIEPAPHHVIGGGGLSIKQVWPQHAETISWPPVGIPGIDQNVPSIMLFTPLK